MEKEGVRKTEKRLVENEKKMKRMFEKDATFRTRSVMTGGGLRCLLCYFDGMVESDILESSVIRPLVQSREAGTDTDVRILSERVLFAGETAVLSDEELVRGMLYGDTILLAEGCAEGLLINTKGWRSRGIDEPGNESVQQGPREGFDEAALPNLSQIRRKLRTPDLCIEQETIGKRSGTAVYLCYLSELASPMLIKDLKKRLSQIDIDGILDSNYINELIRDQPSSIFKTVGSTERPDVVAAKLLEGRIAIVVDGTPAVLTVPYLFAENFQSDEDYYINFWASSIGRFLRYVCFFLTVSLPGIYLALVTSHPRLLPTFLLLSASQARGGVPFSSLTECLLLVFMLEILKEAGARMPQNLGHTLSIVGGLVVGQAAVEARLVSAPMLIVVAFSGIAGLMIPRLRASVFYLRLFLIFLGQTLGLPGCFFGLTVLFLRLLGLSSFGIPYLQFTRDPTLQGWKDTVVRLPWGMMIRRPAFNRNRIRQKRRKKE